MAAFGHHRIGLASRSRAGHHRDSPSLVPMVRWPRLAALPRGPAVMQRWITGYNINLGHNGEQSRLRVKTLSDRTSAISQRAWH